MHVHPKSSPSQVAERLQHPAIFRMGELPRSLDGVVASGFAALDAELSGGWPVARLTELLCDHVGVGELSLLLPVLTSSSQQLRQSSQNKSHSGSRSGSLSQAASLHRRALWIAPITSPAGMPAVAYAPALAQRGVNLRELAFVTTANAKQTLWAAEQALLSGAVRTVFAWIHEPPHDFALRRISQAARKSASLCFLMRPAAAARSASPAELRIAIKPAVHGAMDITLLKRRGLMRETTLRIDTRELSCLAAHRLPIALPMSPALQAQRGKRDSQLSPLLQTTMNTSLHSPPNIRERSFILDR
jgi:hypothetical protein